ncbi:MAG: tyrosine-type recombinase/integrase, partial [Lachnospiraceae bacterium]|nr:tyrosine-type recombinase/integrase [Lachnospiraceae bacterium]
ENRLKHGDTYENKDDLVFTDENGSHLCHPTVWRSFKRRVTAIGCPDLRFHDLRHSFATISIENGDDIKTVSENLGHATVAFTLDVYGHVTDKMKKQSADRMQEYIASICK